MIPRYLDYQTEHNSTPGYGRDEGPISRARHIAHAFGVWYLARRFALDPRRPWIRFAWYPLTAIWRLLSRQTKFRLAGSEYDYGPLFLNGERIVEIPVALDFVAKHIGPETKWLEVGNVLSQYRVPAHETIDKYERVNGVGNVDVLDFSPRDQYDVIVSISTLEHVGWDEAEQDATKARRASEHIFRDCLRPGGRLLVSMPLGYNPSVDQMFASGLPLGKPGVLIQSSRARTWREIPKNELVEIEPYSYTSHTARAVAIWDIQKPIC